MERSNWRKEIVLHQVEAMYQSGKEYSFLKGARVIAEFGGFILCVSKTREGYAFATWELNYGRTGVCFEHGFSGTNPDEIIAGFKAAKRDFAVRSGLVEECTA